MALDGIAIHSIVDELNNHLIDGRIDKVYQPENDEIVLSIRNNNNNYRLLLTSHSSNPRIHFTNIKKNNPMKAPLFCMLLRKHIMSGRILSIDQFNFDRIVQIQIESRNEMGDLCTKRLIIEIMGKHSNIILVDDNDIIVDSIKHVNNMISSIREVLPGKQYVLPPEKNNPLKMANIDEFRDILSSKNSNVFKAIYQSFNGISPIIASEICLQSGIDNNYMLDELTEIDLENLYNSFQDILYKTSHQDYKYTIALDNNDEMIDFSTIDLKIYNTFKHKDFEQLSELLEYYYREKDSNTRIKQKSQDLAKLIQTNLERCYKKKKIQAKQIKDTLDREKWKLKGELITSNIYQINLGDTEAEVINFYDPEQSLVKIKLDKELTPSQNAQKYYKKYNKAKRTNIAAKEQLIQTDKEIEYLETIKTSLSMASTENDISEIRQELHKEGYIKKLKKNIKNKKAKISTMLFKSSEGYTIRVGKNNIQNDYLTFKLSSHKDIWFHVKDMPGSHVILFIDDANYTEKSITEAAKIAAYFSKGKLSSNVPVDYTERRYVKKPNGSKPGFVIYTHQKTLYVTPDKSLIDELTL